MLILPPYLRAAVAPSGGGSSALFEDGVESGDLSYAENGIEWGGTFGEVAVSTERAFEGTHSVRMTFGPDESPGTPNDSSAELDFLIGTPMTEIWVSYQMWIPANYYHRTRVGSNNNKGFLYLWDGAYAGGPGPGMGPNFFTGSGGTGAEADPGESRQKCYIFNGGGFDKYYEDVGQQALAIVEEDYGKWVQIVTHAKYATSANNDGIYRSWKKRDGSWIQMLNLTTMDSYVSGATGFTQGRILGYANSGFEDETKFFVDKLQVNDEYMTEWGFL